MNLGLDALDSIITKDKNEPTVVEFMYHLFFEKGISYEEFNRLPIPYILSMIKTSNWLTQREQKALKKANRK